MRRQDRRKGSWRVQDKTEEKMDGMSRYPLKFIRSKIKICGQEDWRQKVTGGSLPWVEEKLFTSRIFHLICVDYG